MFTIIYDKTTTNVIKITSESDATRLRDALPENYDFIYIEDIPYVKPYREIMVVENNKIKVKQVDLSEDQKIQIHEMELCDLRAQRNEECFKVVNRGEVWYKRLTESQKVELDKWYEEWLNVTETEIVPTKPEWLK